MAIFHLGFWPVHTNMSNKMASSWLGTMWQRSDIRNPQLLTKIRPKQKELSGRRVVPLNVCTRKKSGLREKVGIGVKSWHEGLKSRGRV